MNLKLFQSKHVDFGVETETEICITNNNKNGFIIKNIYKFFRTTRKNILN